MKTEIVNGKIIKVETELDRWKKFINDPRSRAEKLRDDNYDWEYYCEKVEGVDIPKPTSRYDRDFEIQRNEYAQYGYWGDLTSGGRKGVWEERRLLAKVAELKEQGYKMNPGESFEEFVARNREEVR